MPTLHVNHSWKLTKNKFRLTLKKSSTRKKFTSVKRYFKLRELATRSFDLSLPTDQRVETVKSEHWYRIAYRGWNHSLILQEISEIMFPRLSTLQLAQNKIESIERLQKIRMPQIRMLFLGTSTNIKMKITFAV